jgi:hypothetical protein
MDRRDIILLLILFGAGHVDTIKVFRSAKNDTGMAVGVGLWCLIAFCSFFIYAWLGLFETGFALFLGLAQASSRFVLTGDAIVYSKRGFQRRQIPLTEITGYSIGNSNSLGPWNGLVVHTRSGDVKILNVRFSRSEAEVAITDLEYLTHPAPTPAA